MPPKLKVPQNTSDENPAWQNTMAAAFHSAKLDDYHDQLKALDRRVVAQYDFGDPYEVLDGECNPCWPSYLSSDASRYAKSMLESGEALEAHGGRKGALKKYLAVARFGQMMTPDGDFLMDRIFSLVVNRPLKENYQRLASREKPLKAKEIIVFWLGKKPPATLLPVGMPPL